MKHLSRLLSISLALLFCFATNGQSAQKTFPAGSYIVPMDSVMQPAGDKGVFEAYGMVFDLLENYATVYWVIDSTKTTITAPDITIAGAAPVVTGFPGRTNPGLPAGGTISYSGAPFVIVPGEGLTQAEIEAIIGHPDWGNVDIHVSSVPFTANVSRELKGTPPKVALLNNSESLASGAGNAAILEGYLRLAGICPTAYDIVTPNMVRDGILQGNAVMFGGVSYQQAYNILWTPHFTAYDGKYLLADMETLIQNVRSFVEQGNSLFAECASIEVFEHSPNGHFLTTTGISHDGGTMDPARIIYHDTTSPFPQIGDFAYTPTGGHLHNWRPWNSANSSSKMETYAYPTIPSGVPTVASQYNSSVSRFTYDDWDGNTATTNDQWDYYTGGRIDGNQDMGYVVYLGGHSYNNKCKGGGGGGGSSVITGDRLWEFKFKKNLANNVDFTFDIAYTPAGGPQQAITLPNVTSANHAVSAGTDLVVDFTPASFNGKSIKDVSVKNTSAVDITVDSITVSWVNGAGSQKTDKLTDTTDTKFNLYKKKQTSGNTFTPPNDGDGTYTIVAATPPPPGGGGTIGGCVDNAACGLKQAGDEAGIRYVLNTLFNLQYTVVDTTYARSSPIVMDNWLYQGTFNYPSYSGHMYVYDVNGIGGVGADYDMAEWIPASASRNLYTTTNGLSRINFDSASVGSFQALLNLGIPYVGNEPTYTALVDRVRSEPLMGVEHSAAAVVKPYPRSNPNRPTVVYFGTLGGEIEAFDVSSLHGGAGAITELWGYIPKGQLGALQNPQSKRVGATTSGIYPGVDGSPTVAEIYIPNADPTLSGTWKTVLTTLNGKYGAESSVVALDITKPKVLGPVPMFEVQGKDPATGTVIMGSGYRTAIGPVKVISGGVTTKTNRVFAATNKILDPANPNDVGGLRVFAFDLANGAQLWDKVFDYSGTQNDIPGSITLLDDTNDGYVDKVIMGDMEGKIWVLNAADGVNPFGAGVPLYDAGIGFPISASPTVAYDQKTKQYVVVFGTGGTDWACSPISASPCANIYSIIVVGLDTKAVLWKYDLAAGEKVWSSPTVANGTVYVNTAFGTLESSNPSDDLNSTTTQGNLKALNLSDGTETFSVATTNQRGSVYVKDNQAYVTSMDGGVATVGDGNLNSGGTPVNVNTVSWRQN